jgi:DNA-directed RNA polymerase specialized sigma24 family protein
LPPEQSNTPTSAPGDVFATTRWTVVLAAGRRSTPESDRELEELCRTYWFPLYAYIRRHGHPKEDAEDLTQAFFARFLEKNDLARLDSERGRFRAFLLAALRHFLANEWDKSRPQKRGGGLRHRSLDWHSADTQFQVAATHPISPDAAFDREWAMALLGKVMERLRAECVAEGRGAQFEKLKAFLMAGEGEASYPKAAHALDAEETAARVAVHRLRKRYRQLLRAEIANTLADPAQVDAELCALFSAFVG